MPFFDIDEMFPTSIDYKIVESAKQLAVKAPEKIAKANGESDAYPMLLSAQINL